jgi:hypothetical protein
MAGWSDWICNFTPPPNLEPSAKRTPEAFALVISTFRTERFEGNPTQLEK